MANSCRGVHKGIIDLTNWDEDKHGIIRLNGEWEIYWEKLLTPASFKDNNNPVISGFFTIPDSWNNFTTTNGKTLASFGYATFRLTIKGLKRNTRLALKVPNISTSYKLWVEDNLLLETGRVGTNKKETLPFTIPKFCMFHTEKETIQILIQIANFSDYTGGIVNKSIDLGAQAQIINKQTFKAIIDLFIIGSIFTMILYYLGLFFLHIKRKAVILFCLFCILILIKSLLTDEKYFIQLISYMDWELTEKLTAITIYMSGALFLTFLANVYPKEVNKIILRISQLITIPFLILVFFTPAYIYAQPIPFFNIIIILNCLYCLYVFLIASFRKRNGAFYGLLGFIVLFFSYSIEIIYNRLFINYGFFIFILFMSVLLSKIFKQTITTKNVLSKKLLTTENRLLDISDKLNKRIKERTGKLCSANKHLKQVDIKNMQIMQDQLDFYQKISHIIKARLNSIIGNFKLLIEKHSLTEYSNYIKSIKNESDNLSRFCNNHQLFDTSGIKDLNNDNNNDIRSNSNEFVKEVSENTESTKSAMYIDRKNVRILVVEDYPPNQMIVQHHLKDAGFKVDIAEDGEKALDTILKKHFNLIFMDIQMPNMNGLEATRHIRNKGGYFATLPIIAMTANALNKTEDEYKECIASGMNDIINKPIRRNNLIQTTLKWIQHKRTKNN